MHSIPIDSLGPFTDATLLSIRWTSDGRDLTLAFLNGRGEPEEFTFCFVQHLSINITGHLMTWETITTQLPGGRKKVCFDFAHRGTITFECGGIRRDVDGL